MVNKQMKDLPLAGEVNNSDYLIGYIANNEKSSRYTIETMLVPHNGDADAHSEIQNAIRELIEGTDSALDSHISNENNPHAVTLSQAAAQQGNNSTVIGGSIYESSETDSNKLTTRAEVIAITETATQGAPMYMGQLKYGADTVESRNKITGMATDDICGVQETQLSYKWNGSAWTEQPHGNDVTGQYYDILFWYGTWNETIHAGDVSARITCADATAPVWNLMVYDDKIVDGEITTAKLADGAVTAVKLASNAVITAKLNNLSVTSTKLAEGSVIDSKLGARTLTDQAASYLVSTNNSLFLTSWLQEFRNNLKYLFNYKADNNMRINELTDNINLITVYDAPLSIYHMIDLTDSTSSSRVFEIQQIKEGVICYLQIYNRTENDIECRFVCPTMQRRQSEYPLKVKPGYSIEVSYIVTGSIITITNSENLKTFNDYAL
jgi:hypothetical protein